MKRLLFTLAGIAMFAGLQAQCSVIEVPLVNRVNASTLIVEGKVAEQYSYWNTNHTMIYTANKIELYKIFKGSVNTDAIEIITEGGTVGMDRISVEPTLELQVGQVGMFTCITPTRVQNNQTSRNALPQFEAYASLQGFVKYDEVNNTASDPFRTYLDLQTEVYNVCAPAGHHQYIEVKPRPDNSALRAGDQTQAGISITSFSPGTLTAGTGTVLTINGTGFGAVQGTGNVGFKNADDGGATYINPLATQILSWSTNQITVEVPDNAGTGTIQVTNGSAQTATSSGTLTISYAHMNVNFDPGTGMTAYQTDHVDDDGSGGYTWKMNTAFDANASARASFMRAFDTWRCGTGVKWEIGATTSLNDAVSDGTNVICFDNTAPLSAGILGVCYSYWSGCASGPNIVWYVHELDIIFDEGSNITPLTWEYGPATPSGSEYDFETVAVHELGHGHQLGHVISNGAIMHYAITNGTSNRSLGANDLAGGQFVQAKSIITNVCGPGAMGTYVCGTPPVAAFSGTPTTICTGGSVNFTDQSTNTPTSWQWTFTGGTPSSSTLQNPTNIVYSAPGVYDVTLVATNASGSDSHTTVGYITVNSCSSPPVANFSADDVTPCVGQSVFFTDLSTNTPTSWAWTFTGAFPPTSTMQNPTVFYPAPGTYDVSLVATNASGSGTMTVTGYITVAANPTVTSNGSPSQIVCAGSSVTLSGSGATSYSWSGGITNGVPFTASTTNTYTVTGTDANGCIDTDTALVTVNPLPTLSVVSNPANGIVCAGNQATLTASGAQSYSWTGGITNGVAFTPAVTTTYTVTGTDANGCTATATRAITVQSCSAPTTTVPCGYTVNNKQQTISAVNVPGATQYQFKFYNNSTLALVQTVTQASRTLSFTNCPNLYFSNTYRITVAVDMGSGFGAESSINCTLIMGIPKSTVPCGVSYNRYSGYSACPSVAGAMGYRFTFYDNVTSAQVAQVAQTSNYIYFNGITQLAVGTTYKWTVEVRYYNGTSAVYGTPSTMNCTVIMAAPTVTLPCNQTYNRTTGYTAVANVSGGTGYRFRFYQSAVLVAERVQTSNYLYFNQVVGISGGQTYQWTVEVQYNPGTGNVFGPPSTPCNVTFAVGSRLAGPGVQETDDNAEFNFGLSMYPNPIQDGVSPTVVINQADQKDANITVMDLAGRVIYTSVVHVEGDMYTTQLAGFPELEAGMYVMQVQIGDQVQSQKFIAE